MKKQTLLWLVVAAGFYCRAEPPLAEERVVIGQPSIFWHNGEWQTYKNGVWTPYGQTPTEAVQTPNSTSRSEPQTATAGEPNVAVGQTTIGIGQPNVTIGQTTIGIGQPNVTIGQTTIGIGRTTIRIGQPNVGIGQTTIGIGEPNTALGEPNGLGQTTIGIGQPNSGIGQPSGIGRTTIGIGKPTEFFNQQERTSHRHPGE